MERDCTQVKRTLQLLYLGKKEIVYTVNHGDYPSMASLLCPPSPTRILQGG